MFATRRGSLNAIDGDLRVPNMIERVVGKSKPSGDVTVQSWRAADPSCLCEEQPRLRCGSDTAIYSCGPDSRVYL